MKTNFIYVFRYEFLTEDGSKASTRMYYSDKSKAIETLNWILGIRIDLYKQNGTYYSDFESVRHSPSYPAAHCIVLTDDTSLWFEIERVLLF